MCGMLPPSAGKVMLGDRDITGQPFHAVSKLGIVRSFQQTNTFKTVTVEENLFRAMRFGGRSDSHELGLEALLDEFGLSGHWKEPRDKLHPVAADRSGDAPHRCRRGRE
jgi:branched-chain amino acid transport system ATP-binding protein